MIIYIMVYMDGQRRLEPRDLHRLLATRRIRGRAAMRTGNGRNAGTTGVRDGIAAGTSQTTDEDPSMTSQQPSRTSATSRLGASLTSILVVIAIVVGLWLWWSATGAPAQQGGKIRSGWLENHDQ